MLTIFHSSYNLWQYTKNPLNSLNLDTPLSGGGIYQSQSLLCYILKDQVTVIIWGRPLINYPFEEVGSVESYCVHIQYLMS